MKIKIKTRPEPVSYGFLSARIYPDDIGRQVNMSLNFSLFQRK